MHLKWNNDYELKCQLPALKGYFNGLVLQFHKIGGLARNRLTKRMVMIGEGETEIS